MPDMKLGTFIRKARKAKGMTLEELAYEVGSDTGNISRLERDRQGIAPATLEKLLAILDLKVTIEGPGISGAESLGQLVPIMPVPLLDWQDALPWIESGVNNSGEGIGCPIRHGAGAFALRMPSGLSMADKDAINSLHEGDLVFLDPRRPEKNESLVLVLRDNKLSIRQLIIEGDERLIRTLNKDWPEHITPLLPDHRILATAIAITRAID